MELTSEELYAELNAPCGPRTLAQKRLDRSLKWLNRRRKAVLKAMGRSQNQGYSGCVNVMAARRYRLTLASVRRQGYDTSLNKMNRD